jgi:hypothetical protein
MYIAAVGGLVKLRIPIYVDGSRRPITEAEVIIPDRPEPPSGTGRWVWIGRVPPVDIAVTDGWYLSLQPLRKDSITARARSARQRSSPQSKSEKPESLKCDQCDYTTTTPQGLAHHKTAKHPTPRVPFEGRRYRCKDCGETFDSAGALGGHRKGCRKAKAPGPTVAQEKFREPKEEPTAEKEVDAVMVKSLLTAVFDDKPVGAVARQMGIPLERANMMVERAFQILDARGPRAKAVWEDAGDTGQRQIAERIAAGK